MEYIAQILIAIALVAFSWWWIAWQAFEKKLKWIQRAPRHPVFGNVLDLAKSTDTLKVMSKFLEKSNGLCSVDLIVKKIVLISDLKLLEFLLTSTKIMSKSMEYRFLHRWLGNGLLTAEGKRWKKSRKIITPAFHFSILGQFISIYDNNTEIMINLLEKEIEMDSVDIYPYVTMCSLDIICETSMGVSLNAQLDRQSEYVYAVKEMCRITMDRSFSAIKQIDLLYALTRDFYKERKYVKTLHSHTEKVIKSRREELKDKCIVGPYLKIGDKSKEGDDTLEEVLGVRKKVAFLDLLLQARTDEEPLPDWFIREEVDTLMFEGHDTVGAAMSFAFFCLAEHPEVQALAIEEQKEIFGNEQNRPLTFQDVQDMKYLELVIKETLRMYPSVPFYARRTDEDFKYEDGKILPKGTSLIIFVYGVHFNPEIFPDPEKFDPTRFESKEKISPFQYLPFSAGPRNCVGQKFAMHEMKAVISKVLRNYQLLPASPNHNLILAAETVLKSINGVKIKIRKRKWD